MSVNWAQLYADLSAQLQAHVDLPFYQDFFVNFYRAFIDGAPLEALSVTACA